MSHIANTPKPPYYAVIFTSVKSAEDRGYDKMSEKMIEAVSNQDGFLGFESARDDTGITVSYWKDLESIKNWKADIEHKKAQKSGRELWYKQYKIRVAKVERDYSFNVV
jgi:heme-degrading monooxygenase HmoA